MNLDEAGKTLFDFHRAHPETKNMSPDDVTDYIQTLSAEERAPIDRACAIIRAEVRVAVEVLMGTKINRADGKENEKF